MQQPSLMNIIENLSPFFASRDDIRFACIFGSRARGDNQEKSDLDVGIMYRYVPDLMTQGGDVSSIEEITGLEVDITVLNGLPSLRPELAYHLACDAVLVYAREIDDFYEFKTRSWTAWFDFSPIAEAAECHMRARIVNGTYGRPIYAKKA
jgi:predicted nucleotidyltransferase